MQKFFCDICGHEIKDGENPHPATDKNPALWVLMTNAKIKEVCYGCVVRARRVDPYKVIAEAIEKQDGYVDPDDEEDLPF